MSAGSDTTQNLLSALQRAADRLESLEEEKHEPIAVVGMSCRLPGGASDPSSFWTLLREGRDAIGEVPADRWSIEQYYDADPDAAGKMYTRHGGFISGVDQFDPQFFEISPREAASLDPQHRLLLELTWQAFENANLPRERIHGTATGVFVGITNNDYERVLNRTGDERRIDVYFSSGNTLNAAAGRVAYTFGLQGPAMSVDTACSSSLVAVHLACRALRGGECTMAVAAGVNLILSPEGTIALSRGRMVAPDGRCKTFDASADGYVRGEGGGVVILARLSAALAAGHTPLAVIRGSAVNQDGASGGFTVPSGPAQEALIRKALADARLRPADIAYVEAHGTGTPLGDPIEVRALGAVFAEKSNADPLLIGALKTNIGHLESAAGIAGLIKVILSIRHGEIPRHLHFREPSPHIAWDHLPVRVVAVNTPWPAGPRRAGLSAFGASGTNAHVIVEQAPEIPNRAAATDRPAHLLTLSGHTRQALVAQAASFGRYLEAADEPLADIAHAANSGRTHFAHRLAIVVASKREASERLRDWAATTDVPVILSQPKDHLLFDGHCRPGDSSGEPLSVRWPAAGAGEPEWRAVLASLAAAHVTGEPVDWAALDGRRSRPTVQLPNFAFQRRRCWIRRAEQPLLGARLGLPGSTDVRFESTIRTDSPEYLEDHQVHGQVVFPAAGYTALALDAARTIVGAESIVLEQVVFEKPLIVPPHQAVTLQVVCAPDGPRQHTFRVFGSKAGEGWDLHARGRFAGRPSQTPPEMPGRALIGDSVPVDQYYAEIARRGIDFGPAFQSILELRRVGDRSADSRIRNDDSGPGDAGIHPAVLDAAFQTVGAAGDPDGDAALVPFSIGRMRFHRPPSGEISARAMLHGALAEGRTASIVLGDRAGVFAEIDDLELVEVSAPRAHEGSSRRSPAAAKADLADSLYEIEWTKQPRAAEARESWPTPAALVGGLAAAVNSAEIDGRIRSMQPAVDALEDVSIDYAVAALRALGLALKGGESFSEPEAWRASGGVSIYRRLFTRMLRMLAEERILRDEGGLAAPKPGEGGRWFVVREPAACDLNRRLEDLLATHPEADAELRMLDRCGRQLAEVIRGRAEPLPLLFPAGDPLSAATLYQDSPGARLMNGLVQRAVRDLLGADPASSELRVLEIGAGTGGTTRGILPLLPPNRTRYDFTDVSPQFLTAARAALEPGPPVRYSTLDIERDPVAQGFAPHTYDLVIAANVLHATRDLGETIRHAHRLLAPGGILLLLEGLKPLRFIDLIFGLTEGWWRFEDARRPEHPLLSAPAWRALLTESGFSEAAVLSREEGLLSRQGLVVARSAGAAQPLEAWVLLADRGGVGRELGNALADRGVEATLVFADQGDPAEAISGVARALMTASQSPLPLKAVVHLWSLDLPDLASADTARLDAELERLCQGSIDAIRSVASLSPAPRFAIVTRGAQPSASAPTVAGCVAATLWGVSRTAAIEVEELRAIRVDLPPIDGVLSDTQRASDARDVASALRDEAVEDEVAFRGDARFVPRLRRRSTGAATPSISSDRTYVVTGGLGGLGLLTAGWLVQSGARHLALLARSAPDAPAAAQLESWRAAGVDVSAIRCNVAVEDQVKQALASARAMAPIAGIFHSAGTLADGTLAHQSWDKFQRVFAAKVYGTWNLHRLTSGDPLEAFVVYSSTASVLGSPGQGNHAAANAFADALAWHRRSLGLPALSINWGAWSDVGAAQRHGVEDRAKTKGIGSIDPASGLAVLERLLSAGLTQVACSPIDWNTLARHFTNGRIPSLLTGLLQPGARDAASRPRKTAGDTPVAAARPGAGRPELVPYMLQQLAGVLDLPVGELDVDQPLNTVGLDSLMALELRNRFKTDLGVSLPVAALLTGSTVHEIATLVGAELAAVEQPAGGGVEVAALSPAPARSSGPLSHGQRALWFLHQTAPQSAAYNTAFAVSIQSSVDVALLDRAFNRVVARHEALRTTFRREDGAPVRQVWGALEIPLLRIDASGWDDEDVKREVELAYAQPFDLERGPLARAALFTRGQADHVLLLTLHHIVGDAWSLWVIVDELLKWYRGEIDGHAPALPPAAGYSQFVRWQSALLDSADGEKLWKYWQKALASELPPLDLPADRPRPPVRSHAGASLPFQLSPDSSRALRELSRREGATLYAVLLAAFEVFLHRFSAQDEIVVGSLTSGRTNADFAEAVGYFVNPVVLRSRVRRAQTFSAFLAGVRQSVLEAIEHQDLPFPLLVERLQPRRDPSRSPMFQVLFVLQKAPLRHSAAAMVSASGHAASGDLRLEPFPLTQMEGQFDLTLEVTDADPISGVFKYSTDLFDAGTIRRASARFEQLLEAITANPLATLDGLAVASPEDERLLTAWNDTPAAYSPEACIHDLLREQAERTPDRAALTFENATWTYRELDERAEALARRLRARGVGRETLVGVCMHRSLDLVAALLAVLKAGAAYVPLEPDYPRDRLDFMLEDSGVAMLVTEPHLVDRFPRRLCPAMFMDGEAIVAPDPIRPVPPDPAGSVSPDPIGSGLRTYDRQAAPNNLAYMIYTSGSTGRPKGAMNTHRALCNRLLWMQREYGLDESDAVLQKTPFSFDVSVWEFFWPLLAGARLVLCKPGGHQDPAYLASIIRRERITTLHFVPSMLRAFLEQPDLGAFPALRRVICSGEALSRDLEQQHLGLVGAELHNLYGPTEAAIDVTFWRCRPGDEGGPVPIGLPIANTQVHIVDRAFERCPIGVPGELCIGGINVGRGYHARPDLTADRFVPDPFAATGARMYRTGDLARWRADGAIEYLGRLDHQVKIRGFRIELGEIESRLSEHPAIREVAVVARSDRGEVARLVAYGVADRPPSTTELHRFVGQTLPDYMVPSAFVWLPEMPLSPNGKLDRRALPEPQAERPRLDNAFDAPASHLERQIAGVWRDVLRVDRIGVRDNFFELGGHSLVLAQVHARLQDLCGLNLTMVEMFQFPTIHLLAQHCTEPLVPALAPEDAARLSLRRGDSGQLARRRQARVDVAGSES